MPHFGPVGEHESKSLLSAGSLEGEGDGENREGDPRISCNLRFMEKCSWGQMLKASFHKRLPETHDTANASSGPAERCKGDVGKGNS